MKIDIKQKIKYIDFDNLTVLSWHIRNSSINDISKLSIFVTPKNIHKLIFPYEFIILSTCNRVEVYIYSYKKNNLHKNIISYINNKFNNNKNVSHLMNLKIGKKAYRHLLNVTCGLKSLALGEYQIQGQVKNAYLNAIKDRYISSYLISIFESALKTGKRVRTETEIGYNNISLSSLAIDIMFQYHRPSKNKPILVVGTGKMSKLAAEHFIKLGYTEIIFFSNTPKDRVNIAKKYNSLILPVKELYSFTKKYKFIFAAPSSLTSRISLDALGDGKSELFVIDLSVPSFISKSTLGYFNSTIIDMETIKELENNYFSILKPCLTKCQKIINNEIEIFSLNNKRRYKLNKLYSKNMVQINN